MTMDGDAISAADAAVPQNNGVDNGDITMASVAHEDDPIIAEPRRKKPKVEEIVIVQAGVVDENGGDTVEAPALCEKHNRKVGTCVGLAPHTVAVVDSSAAAVAREQHMTLVESGGHEHTASVASEKRGEDPTVGSGVNEARTALFASGENAEGRSSSVGSEGNMEHIVLARGDDGERTALANEENEEQTVLARGNNGEDPATASGQDAEHATVVSGEDAEHTDIANGDDGGHTAVGSWEVGENPAAASGDDGGHVAVASRDDGGHSAVGRGEDGEHASVNLSVENRETTDASSTEDTETRPTNAALGNFFSSLPHGNEVLAEIFNANGIDVDDSPTSVFRRLWRLIHGHMEDEVIPPKVFDTFDIDGVADKINRCSNIIVMVGAGLSTAAGIPDFRTPGTGLYDNLSKYNLPEPESLFTLEYFRSNPAPFYDFCQQLWPDSKNYRPTFAHYFVTLLEKKGKLLRCYSQNIDSLEELAGLSDEKLVAAHGNFSKCRGIDTQTEVPTDEVKEAVMQQTWKELVERHGELVKPDIVFFGEELPTRFRDLAEEDFPKCDLLFVLGTSLVVAPFNHLISFTEIDCPRVLVNREEAGTCPISLRDAFRFNDAERNYRDVFLQGDLNGQIRELCAKLEWLPELESLAQEQQSVR
eukprot:GEMP01006128.1.p1 GENE.GEMP01006128.1~~GEMP01006128.1.p1  ORF type:complete len:648 (+),score=147.40 GEMP01006128.1:213-2156(+)